MGNYLTIHLELDAIKNFLDKTLESVDSELSIACARDEADEFKHSDDFANAIFFPMRQEEIAIRATLYEINALVEWELGNLAGKFHHTNNQHSKASKRASDKPFELNFGQICKLIKKGYGINLNKMPGSEKTRWVRETVNDFKHRYGFKDPRKHLDSKRWLEQSRPARKDAYEAIDEAKAFLIALNKKCKRHEDNKGD